MDDYQNPKAGKTYISPRLKAFGDSDRTVRIASKVIDSPDSCAFAKIKDEIVLRHKEDAKSYITGDLGSGLSSCIRMHDERLDPSIVGAGRSCLAPLRKALTIKE